MDLLIVVSTPQSGPIANALGNAAVRAGTKWRVFFTNDGVSTLTDQGFAKTVSKATTAIACTESWHKHMGDVTCPIELGSQTNNSTLVGQATKIVSL